jgi:hypothetical protein
MKRRPAQFLTLLLAAAAVHGVLSLWAPANSTPARPVGETEYICTACGPISMGPRTLPTDVRGR